MSIFDPPVIEVLSQASDDAMWNTVNPFFPSLGSVKSSSGTRVSAEVAQKIAAYWCGTRMICDAMMSIPPQVKKTVKKEDGAPTKVTLDDDPLHKIFNIQFNPKLNATDGIEFFQQMLLNWGTCFAEMVRNRNSGRVVELYPIHTSRIRSYVVVNEKNLQDFKHHMAEVGDVLWCVWNDKGAGMEVTWIHERDMFWITGPLSEDGLTGKSTIRMMAEVLGIARAQDKHVGAFYKNGASPDLYIRFQGPLNDDQRGEIRQSWKTQHAGSDNAHRLLILHGGAEVGTIGINPADAQLLESREFGIYEVARALKIHPRKLGVNQQGQKSSPEDQSIDFSVDTIQPWGLKWKAAIAHKLLPNRLQAQGYTIEHDLHSLHKFNMTTMTEHVDKMFKIAVYNVDEARGIFGLNPVPNGDIRFFAANNLVPLNQAAKTKYEPVPDQSNDEEE